MVGPGQCLSLGAFRNAKKFLKISIAPPTSLLRVRRLDRATTAISISCVSDEPDAKVSGRYFYHSGFDRRIRTLSNLKVQDDLLCACEELTGVALPKGH